MLTGDRWILPLVFPWAVSGDKSPRWWALRPVVSLRLYLLRVTRRFDSFSGHHFPFLGGGHIDRERSGVSWLTVPGAAAILHSRHDLTGQGRVFGDLEVEHADA